MQDKHVALVTGANKGIGLQIAKDLAKHGLTVLVGSRSLANGETAAKSVGEDAHAIQLDVTDAASIASAAGRILNEFRRLDVLVNNAGITSVVPPGTSFEERMKTNIPSTSPLDNIRGVFETNVAPSRGAGGANRQHRKFFRFADSELKSKLSTPPCVRRRLQSLEDGPARDLAGLRA
jgi:NAD(P)-dependent dehydrogenase (short-subunit alcohol dehydrogenase family)